MIEPVRLLGADPLHWSGWSQGATITIHPTVGIDSVYEAEWVIEAHMGPLSVKRERLRQLEDSGIHRVLTSSVMATLAAQETWIRGQMHLVGCDPLLMAAAGQTQTVVGATEEDIAWLSSLWPDRTFIRTADAIGLVFTREILPIINEAVDFVARGLNPKDIDAAMKLGLHYPKGPWEWAETFGWPAVYWGLAALEDMFGPRFRPHPWIRQKVGSALGD